ncbi:PhnD/SsuA/transferrin family substrate-binding protein [Natrarchaeobaculum aegyptiacum]|uniref:Phosphonate ABC transporter substrate-binding protein n=1 Tax=Natrarchaeobaculum aegyptiacum TaxID=745377 RepID=A0A2Z2HT22_9EURY|nr:PhnD/SsuA/transferrin family substrate-binding protein [Natrarchaeobaculum aegyptiacum]ARS88567.1 phosphonate ABC transporter substrate-binding protein [Natrarchaeobaculum aegyptiacum]
MDRRTYLGGAGSALLAAGAGCLGGNGDDGDGSNTEGSGDAGAESDADTDDSVGAWSGGEIEFALPPFQDLEELQTQYAGTFEWLEDGFDGVDEVTGQETTSYAAAVESVVQGHSELGNLSPMIFALAQEDGVHPLAVNWSHGSDSYRTYIVTRAETGIESLADLEGETIALVDPLSASGGIFPQYTLREAGIDAGDVESDAEDVDVEWAGGHGNALTAVEQGHVAAAAYGDFQHPDDDETDADLEVVAESDPIPFDVVVATPDTPEDVREALAERLQDTPAENLEDHRVDEYGEFDPDLYDQTREIAIEMGVDIDTLDDAESED